MTWPPGSAPMTEIFDHSLMMNLGGALSFVHITVAEPASPRAAVLCFHDFVGRSNDFLPLARILARQGYRVVMPDFPGRGRSAALPPEHYNLRTVIDVATGVLGQHGLGDTILLGQGWGSTMALAVENVTARPFHRAVLCDLPLVWSYAEDPRAQIWHELCQMRHLTVEDFLREATLIHDRKLPASDRFQRAVAARLQHCDGAFELAVDSGIFELLTRSPDVRYRTVPMVTAAKSEIFMLQSRQVSANPSKDMVPDHSRKGMPIANLWTGCQDFSDWSDLSAALPVIGAIILEREGLSRA